MAGGIPQNAQAIYKYLTGQGFSPNAAAGILGNMEQESGGSPTAGSNPPGAGLIQILGDPGGNLQSELARTMAYIRANGSISDINKHASTPAEAAQYFSTKYERPNPAAANNANRIASAQLVAKAAKSGNWKVGANSGSGNAALGLNAGISAGISEVPGFAFLKPGISTISGVGQTIGDIATGVGAIANDLSTLMHFVTALFRPNLWLRVGAFFVGMLALAAGAFFAAKAVGLNGPKMPSVIPIPV